MRWGKETEDSRGTPLDLPRQLFIPLGSPSAQRIRIGQNPMAQILRQRSRGQLVTFSSNALDQSPKKIDTVFYADFSFFMGVPVMLIGDRNLVLGI